MTIKITYFVHGTSVDNEKKISSGWKDTELSELGINQAKSLYNQIADKNMDVIFCSDLKRAVDSAHLAFEGKIPIEVDSRLRECSYGVYNGGESEVVEPLQKQHIYEPFENGESYEDVKARTSDFIDMLKENYNGKSVGIVAHKAPQFAFEVLTKGKSWEQVFEEDWRKRKAWQPGWVYFL